MKLVRDRIPTLAAGTGQPAAFHQADPAEFGRLLRAKLLEEAAEAATAGGPGELLDELGDVLQVLYALASQAGLEPASIECARKARIHGVYTRRLIWQPAPGPAAPLTPKEVPVREHATSIHLMLDPDMLDPDDPRRLEVEAASTPSPSWATPSTSPSTAGAADSLFGDGYGEFDVDFPVGTKITSTVAIDAPKVVSDEKVTAIQFKVGPYRFASEINFEWSGHLSDAAGIGRSVFHVEYSIIGDLASSKHYPYAGTRPRLTIDLPDQHQVFSELDLPATDAVRFQSRSWDLVGG